MDAPSSETHSLPDVIEGAITVDVEDWYHILDSGATLPIERWHTMESRVEANLHRLLDVFSDHGTRATFFWLGWLAERLPDLVRRCATEGHEIASHGYGHLLAYQVGPEVFEHDVAASKAILEDTCGQEVRGFRAPGFGIKDETDWAFDIIRSVGHTYDSSLFPAIRRHGGMPRGSLDLHRIATEHGPLLEVPISAVRFLGVRFCPFAGGYFRATPRWLLTLAARQLRRNARPIVALAHPREIDPEQPRLDLHFPRRWFYYHGIAGTEAKLEWLLRRHRLGRISDVVDTDPDQVTTMRSGE